MLDLPGNIKVSYVSVEEGAKLEEKARSLSSENEKLKEDSKVSLEKSKSLLSMNKYYSSTGNIRSIGGFESIKRTKYSKSKQNLLRTTLEKNGETAEYYSMNNISNDSSKMKHSLSSHNFLTVERNSREYNGSIARLRKTLTNPYLSKVDSSDSLFSGNGSTDSICSSAYSINASTYSVCDSCDSICESVADLMQQKETKKFSEMENGHLKLITYNQCPKWLTDNPYIITKYRPPCYSYWACYKSLFYLHNETGNVYTHLIGAIVFTVFYLGTAFQYIPVLKNIDSLEMISIIMSVVGGFICMYFSWHFHLFSSHSLKVNRNWLTCDFIGIVSLIYTTGLPLSYYSFYCYPDFRAKYMGVSAIIGAISFLSMLNPIFSKDEYRLVRSFLFLILAASELIPIGYALFAFNSNILLNYLSFRWIALGASFYLIGLILYAKRIPEVYYPGAFDLLGHSHQIFHTLILLASVAFYIGIMKTVKAFNYDLEVCSKLF